MVERQDQHYMRGHLSGFLERERFRHASQHIQSGAAVLDLACNEGDIIPYLPVDVTYLGIDINAAAIEHAREKYPNHTFQVADLFQSLPGMDRTFDAIIMLAFLEHIAQPEKVLRTCRDVLTPDGRVLLTTPAPWGRRVHDLGAQMGLFSQEAADEHETFLGKTMIYQIAEAADMQVDTFHYFLFGFNQFASLKQL